MSTLKLNTMLLALSLCGGTVMAVNLSTPPTSEMSAVAGVNGVTNIGNDMDRYNTLKAQLDELELSYDIAVEEADALGAQGATYAYQLSMIFQQITAMQEQLETAFNNQQVTSDYTLADYANIAGQVAQLRATLEQTINGTVSSILSQAYPTVNGWASAIGSLQTQLNTWGVAEQFADRVAALSAKQQEADAKVQTDAADIQTETDYAKKMNKANAIKEYLNTTGAEIQAEITAIQEEAEAIYNAKVAANQAAYERLSAELAELQASLDYAQQEVNALTPILGGSFAGGFNYKITMIQQQINVVKGQVEQANTAVALTEESQLSDYNPQLVGTVSDLRSTLDNMIPQQIGTIFNNLTGTVDNGLGSAIGSLEQQLSAQGLTEEFADRIAALKTKSEGASAKVDAYREEVNAIEDLVEKLNKAVEARDEINAIVAEINAEIEAIKADAEKITTGISGVKAAESLKSGQVYDLSGKCVSAPGKGLYIVNGKKVVIK